MNSCIKCGSQIPEGELFCIECSLNPGSSMFEEPRPAPVGRMQAPQPRKVTPAAVAEPKTKSQKGKRQEKQKNAGLKAALVLVSLLLVLLVGLGVWQYDSIRAEWNRLETKEADMQLREQEKKDLELLIDDLNQQLGTLEGIIREREDEIKELRAQLSGSQSSQSQSAYDLSTIQLELTRLEEENQQLLILEEEKEVRIKELTNQLNELAAAGEKATFLDKYVVFVNNDNTNVYHTYDCPRFTKSDFWAYSRKLAENQGFTPCATCGGRASAN